MISMMDTKCEWVWRRNRPSLEWLESLAAQACPAYSVLTVLEILRAAKEQELAPKHGVSEALDSRRSRTRMPSSLPTLSGNVAPGSSIHASRRL